MTVDVANAAIRYGQFAFGAGVFAWLYLKYWKDTLRAPWLKKTAWVTAIFYALVLFAKIGSRYYFLKTNDFGKLELPPYQSWGWFVRLELLADIAPYLIALAVAVFMYAAATLTNRRFKRELFLEPDRYILFIAALVCGWPNFVLYFFTVVLLSVPYSVFSSWRQKSASVRIILTHVLIIAMPLVLISGDYIAGRLNFWMLGLYG